MACDPAWLQWELGPASCWFSPRQQLAKNRMCFRWREREKSEARKRMEREACKKMDIKSETAGEQRFLCAPLCPFGCVSLSPSARFCSAWEICRWRLTPFLLSHRLRLEKCRMWGTPYTHARARARRINHSQADKLTQPSLRLKVTHTQ